MENTALITSSKVAKILEISSGSVTLWASAHLPELQTNKFGHKLYSPEYIEHLKKVKALLKKGHRHDKIKEMLAKQENKQQEAIKNLPEELPKNNEVPQPDINISSCVLIPDAIFDRLDLKANITNDDLKYLFRRISELEEENKRLQAL